MKETFGEFVKKQRIKKGLTLTKLAAKLDLDSANLSKIENGKRDFDEKRLPLLSEVIEVDLSTLKTEYFGDFIAKKIYDIGNSNDILLVAEEKVKYLRSIKNSDL